MQINQLGEISYMLYLFSVTPLFINKYGFYLVNRRKGKGRGKKEMRGTLQVYILSALNKFPEIKLQKQLPAL